MGRYTDTQLASWQKVKKTLGKMHYDVLSIIQVRGGASSQEIADCLHRPLHSISGRLRELQDQGKICDSGKRYLNQKSGHTQIIWVAQLLGQGGKQIRNSQEGDGGKESLSAGRTSMT